MVCRLRLAPAHERRRRRTAPAPDRPTAPRDAAPACAAGLAAGGLVAAATGLLALRTRGVSFMIVTLMFAQAGYLTILQFGWLTRGDEGFVLPAAARSLGPVDLAQGEARYLAALALFALAFGLSLWLVRRPTGRIWVAMRENEERARLLGYDSFRARLSALVASGAFSGAAGAAYAILLGYAGASVAGVQYSILPLLWVLLGGAGTVLGPFLGTLFMFYLIDIASGLTGAYMLVAGAALIALTLLAPQGLMGTLRARVWPWLP